MDANAAAGDAFIRQAQVIEAERTGVPAPAGLAFSSAGSAFYVLAAPPGAGPSPAETEVVKLTPDSDRAGSARIAAALRDPISVAFDSRRSRLLLLDNADRLLELQADANGDLDPRTLVRRDGLRLDLQDAQGMAVDPASGTVFILDAAQPRILRVEPAPDGSLEGAIVSEVDLRQSGLSDVRGLAFDPSTGHVHVGGPQKLVELTTAGEVVAHRDLAALSLASPQGFVFAPSGDQTDDPAQQSLYLADSGGRRAGSPQSAASSGEIVELSLTPVPAAAASTFTASLVHTIDTGDPPGTFVPPSPDPSGLTYLPATNTLLMSDAEVEETVSGITHFQGVNVWEMTLDGNVVDTANISKVAPTVVPMTNEPTGVTWNPSNGHYFVSQDDGDKVYDLNPGGDGEIGTADDNWTSFTTSAGDPEGIAYDTLLNRLFVADGVNAEIYEYTTTGALLSHFDVLGYGVADPETVEYNAQSDTLFVLSNRASGPIIVETTKSGALLQTIDVSAGPDRKPAGLAYAPASDGSGAMHFYFADREIDNNSDPNIVDGKIFEFTAPASGTPGNNPPTVNAGLDQTIALPASATLDGTVSDDGLPNPPGTLTTSWSQVSGPGTVTFGDANAVDTSAGFSAVGSYVLRLTASDSALSAADELTVTVNPAGQPSALYLSLRSAGTVGGVTAANEDIVSFNGTTGFSLAFDGSDVGISSLRIDAFSWLDLDSLLLSFDTDGAVLPGAGTVDDSDIVQFDATSLGPNTAGAFTLYFDGSDVGLTASAHDVDAVEPLPDGRILISTGGSVTLPGVPAGRDEDLLAFTPVTLGDTTSGSFSMYFEGSDVGLGDSGEDVDAAAVASGNIYLSTTGVFAVPGVGGQDEDVFVFTPSALGDTTAGSYSPTLYFDGSAFGLDANDVFAIDLP